MTLNKPSLWIPRLTPFNTKEVSGVLPDGSPGRVCLHENISSNTHLMILYFDRRTPGRLHYLTNRTKFLHIISGDAELEIYEKYDGNLKQTQAYRLGCGDVIHIPKMIPHRLTVLTQKLTVLEVLSGAFDRQDMQILAD